MKREFDGGLQIEPGHGAGNRAGIEPGHARSPTLTRAADMAGVPQGAHARPAADSTAPVQHAPPVQLMLDLMANAFIELDLQQAVVQANAAAERLLGRMPDAGLRLQALLPWLPGSGLDSALQQASGSGEEQAFVVREPNRGAWWQGRVLPHDAGLSLYLRDVSAQRRAGLAERVFRMGLDQMRHGVLVCAAGTPTGQPASIEFASPQALSWLAPAGGALEGQPLDAVLLATLSSASPDWPPRLHAGQPAQTLKATLQHDTSQLLALSCQPVHEDGDAEASHWLVLLHDHTLAQAEEQQRLELEAVFNQSEDGVLLLDARQLGLRQVNPRLRALAGLTRAQLAAFGPAQWLRLLQPERADAGLSTLVEGHSERRYLRPGGGWRPIAQRLALVRDADGQPRLWVCHWRDQSERHEAAGAIERLRLFDPLTGLLNRHGLRERADALFGRVHAQGGRCALYSIDLGNLHEINQHCGMAAGDRALTALAGALAAASGSQGLGARMGSSRFALFVLLDDAEDPLQRMQQILQRLQGAEHATLGVPPLRVAAGVALCPDDAPDLDHLLLCSELALDGSRKRQDGAAQRFSLAELDRSRARRRLIDGLQNALACGQFELHYQPQVDPRDNRVTGAEALLRWCHPSWGMISPAQFIPLAEEIGLIGEIGRWVLHAACTQAQRWSAGGPLTVAVNLSPLQLAEPDIVEQVAQALASTGLPSAQLEVEITEGVLMDASERIEGVMRGLKALGVQLVLDDFGTGYSSLAYLQRLPLDVLKIDRSFVQGVVDQPRQRAVTEAVIAVSRALGLSLVAEGVETREQLAWLRSRDCELIQGYLFSRPQPVAALDTLMYTRRVLEPSA